MSNIFSRMSHLILFLIITFLLNLWFENSKVSATLYSDYVEPIVDNTRLPIVYTLFFVGIIIFIGYRYFSFTKSNLEEEIKDLNEKLTSEMQILISANQELSNYRFKDNLETIFRKFITQNKYVHAVQSYRFIEKNHREKTVFTLNFLTGSVFDDVNINAIHQMTFPINRHHLESFREAIEYVEEDISELSNFVVWAFNELERTSSNTDEEIGLYMLMDLALEILEAKANVNFAPNFDDVQNKRYEELRSLRRTGLIRSGILKEGFYSFTYEGDNEKASRQYLVSFAEISGEPHLLSIALDRSILDGNYEEALNKVKDEFTLLLNELENGYNL
ncbi:hypothetical protein [Exiguobacterium sp. s189]|uniref:hypothetical protein n=1 Tax=Exiguobacterium sp. s189 TaxID=2751263 RepID=UPI001BE5A8D4|nr:hypothetical protein [Exiguobacterium sp. s189]